MKIKISDYVISDKSDVFFIAEAGINHNGSVKIAKKMIEKAKQANVNAIKFQTFTAKDLASPSSPYFKIFKKLELDSNDFEEISDYAKSQELVFCSTPFSETAVNILTKIKVPLFKIASGDLTHLPLISHIASKKKPIILSTGMGNNEEIRDAVKIIQKQNNNKIILMHSVSAYPTPPLETNLKSIKLMKEEFQFITGYSDNGPGLEVPLTAIAMGAKVIEKHFTLDNKMKGPDHKFSVDPKSLKLLVKKGHEVTEMIGDGKKRCMPSELENRMNARRSIKALSNIKKGEKITKNNITITRPANGILPKELEKIIGKKVKKNIQTNEPIQWKFLTK